MHDYTVALVSGVVLGLVLAASIAGLVYVHLAKGWIWKHRQERELTGEEVRAMLGDVWGDRHGVKEMQTAASLPE